MPKDCTNQTDLPQTTFTFSKEQVNALIDCIEDDKRPDEHDSTALLNSVPDHLQAAAGY